MPDADALFAQHRDGVFRYLRRFVGQADVAQDLTQEVFLRVTRAGAPAVDNSRARAWIFRIARNLALNHLRDGRRRPRTIELLESAGPATQELSAALDEALDSLPVTDRHVFLMRETSGLSYEDIAAASELSVEAVRARLRRTRQHLRERLRGSLDVQRRYGVRIGKGDS
jgi:RNA polymerase sigma-70 factor (ECF subfamily)